MSVGWHGSLVMPAVLIAVLTVMPSAQAAPLGDRSDQVAMTATTVMTPQFASLEGPIDRRDRSEAARAYLRWLVPAEETRVRWTGSAEGCVTGTESAASRTATIAAVNYFRAMTGLPPVVEYEPWSAKALQTALMMRAALTLDHYPDVDWPCYTADGAQGAGSANLSLGNTGARAVFSQLRDRGANNAAVGHRRWILYPPATRMGTGSTDYSNALWVIDRDRGWDPPRPAGVDWVAWPPAGYVPWEVALVEDEGRQLFRWSLSSNTMPHADYSEATVAATLSTVSGVEGLRVIPEVNDPRGFGDQTLAWNAWRPDNVPFPVTESAQITITVRGIVNEGTTVAPYTYTVDAFRAAFTDIADSTHRFSIEAVDAAGFAGGFPDGTFRASGHVTRGQMASFLARALDLPPAGDTTFSDTSETTHAAGIEAVAAAGITGGFGDGTFRPSANVTRAQLAAFLDRALDLPAASGTTFSDTPGTTHAAAIEAVTAAGIAGGFADGTFRPSSHVTRGQMASFLAKALRLS